jgi:hypothetical protein
VYPMSPYGPSMVDQYGQDASNGLGLGHFLARFGYQPQNGGGMPPMQQQGNTGIMPPNALTGGGLAPQQAFAPQSGGGGQMQQMPQNRLGGFGGGYNFGVGGLLR